MNQVYVMIVTMSLVTYFIRAVPLLVFRQRIKQPFIRSFLYYVPCVTLSLMIFPDVLFSTGSTLSAAAGFLLMMALAYLKKNMFVVAISGCAAVFLIELIF